MENNGKTAAFTLAALLLIGRTAADVLAGNAGEGTAVPLDNVVFNSVTAKCAEVGDK